MKYRLVSNHDGTKFRPQRRVLFFWCFIYPHPEVDIALEFDDLREAFKWLDETHEHWKPVYNSERSF